MNNKIKRETNIVDVIYEMHSKKFIQSKYFMDLYNNKKQRIDNIPKKNNYSPKNTHVKYNNLINEFNRFLNDTSQIFTKNMYTETNLGNFTPTTDYSIKTKNVGSKFNGTFAVLSNVKLYQKNLDNYDKPVFSFKDYGTSLFLSEGVTEHSVNISFTSYDVTKNKSEYFIIIVNDKTYVTRERNIVVTSSVFNEYIYDWSMREFNSSVSVNSPFAYAVKNGIINTSGILETPQVIIQKKVHRLEINDIYVGAIKNSQFPFSKEVILDIQDKDFFIIGAKTKLYDVVIKYNDIPLKIGNRNTVNKNSNKITLIFNSSISYVESLQILT